jgi:hypothetical protein
MDDRRSKKGPHSEGPPRSAMPLVRETPEGRPLEIAENTSFYDWRGQALSSHERRARLDAFRPDERTSEPPSSAPDSRSDEGRRRTLPVLEMVSEVEPEPEPPSESEPASSPSDIATMEDIVTTEPVAPPSHFFTHDSDVPVVAEGFSEHRERSSSRPIYLTLFGATILLVVIAVIGLLRFNEAPSPANDRVVAVQQPVATPISVATEGQHVPLVADTKEPSATGARGAEDAPPAVASAGATENSSPLPSASASPSSLAPTPPVPVMNRPRTQGTQPTATPSGLVPNDTPKF